MNNGMSKLLILVGGVVLIVLLACAMCLSKVRLNEIGVKVNQISGQGIAKSDYGPGYYFVVPGMHKMYRLDPTVQTLQMGGDGADDPALQLMDEDQYTTKIDITIAYRIRRGEAHKIAKQIGLTNDLIRVFVRGEVKKALWDELARLKTEDFYNIERREEARVRTRDSLGQRLKANHLEVVDVLIRSIVFDPRFEAKLVQKQLLDQNKALNVEKTRLERELQKTQAIERETDAKVKVIVEERTQETANIVAQTDASINEINANAEFEAQKMLAEADRHRRQQESEGELARTQAKAKGEKAINEAYLGLGGQAYITRQMIESLEFGEIEINTNRVNPFDVDQLLEMLGYRPQTSAAPSDASSKRGG